MDLSIIIPVYNHEKYIEKCLKSIIVDLPEKSEIIIIDDVCTDSSIEKIEKLNCDKIKIYKNEKNMGCAYNLNKGIELAQGKYIGINYSDDFVEEGFYKKMLEVAQQEDADIVCSNLADYDEENDKFTYNNILENNIYCMEKEYQIGADSIVVPAGFLLGHWTAASASTKIIKKDFYKKHKFYGSKANDIPAIYPIMAEAKKIIFCPNLYLFYREVKDSLSRKDDEDSYNSVIKSMIKAFEDLDKIGGQEEKEILFFNNCLLYLFFALTKIENTVLSIKCIQYFYDKLTNYDKNIFINMQQSVYYQYFLHSKNIDKEIYQALADGDINLFIEMIKISPLKKESENLKREIINIKKQNDDLSNQNKDLKNQNKDLTNKIATHIEENQKLREQNIKKDQTIKSLSKENENYYNNILQLEKEKEKISIENENLDKKLREFSAINKLLEEKIKNIINGYENSKSWKITKPLRSITSIIKKENKK